MNRVGLFLVLFALSFAFAQDGGIIVEVITNPTEASIYINNEKVGVTPAAYQFAMPGAITLGLQKENYEPWDTTLILQPAQNQKIDIALREKSIFSKEGEIDFQKILAQDTTIDGYRQRKDRVLARIYQIDSEMNAIYANFSSSFPALEPQGPKETAQAFESRTVLWQNEFSRQAEVLRQKYETYRNNLTYSLNVLESNINNANIAAAESLKAELAKEAAVAATKPADTSASSGGLGWRGWTRILTFTATAAFGAMAVMKHLNVKDSEKDISDLNANPPPGGYPEYEKKYKSYDDSVTDNKSQRTVFGVCAGVFAVAGTLTFFF